MASNAYDNHLIVLLRDADELDDAHRRLRTGQAGRQWGLGSLNRAVVVMCVSAWESYIEEVLRESLEALRPAPPSPMGTWPALNASARSQIGRFNNPNSQNVRQLISDCIGVADVTSDWRWQRTTDQRARDRLDEVMRNRHHIAHGVNPRPTIHNTYSSDLPGFFRMLARQTDGAIRHHLVAVLGVANPWPA